MKRFELSALVPSVSFMFMISEPNFVYMDFVGESVDSPDGDDDKVYLFFSENAMEFEFYNKLVVSRVARVCKVFTTDKTNTEKKQVHTACAKHVFCLRGCSHILYIF